jgi:hypothetical protein
LKKCAKHNTMGMMEKSHEGMDALIGEGIPEAWDPDE